MRPPAGKSPLATPIVPPVATYVDDTPLFVNLRLQDLDHVEILRGPQGTLYGSGSLGGTIRFVQNAPDPGGFDAKVETGRQRYRAYARAERRRERHAQHAALATPWRCA